MTQLRAPRVLVVEDEFLVRLTLAEALTEEGFEVIEAGSGDEALALLQRDPLIAVLMTDIQLPGTLNGLHLVLEVRRDRPDMPVIYMTGRPESLGGLVTSGRDTVIAKPYLPSEVTEAVRRLTAVQSG